MNLINFKTDRICIETPTKNEMYALEPRKRKQKTNQQQQKTHTHALMWSKHSMFIFGGQAHCINIGNSLFKKKSGGRQL